jgi:hypothetical protein
MNDETTANRKNAQVKDSKNNPDKMECNFELLPLP